MLSRRAFVSMTAASVAARALGDQTANTPDEADVHFSVMMWTLKELGTFDENLERVAQAGYHKVQLIGEFKDWSNEDHRRILARMERLRISVDATSGVVARFSDISGGDAFIADLKELIPMVQRIHCTKIILLSGKIDERFAPGAQHSASIEAIKRAADVLGKAELTAVIEPTDRIKNPTVYLDGVAEAFEIVKSVGSPNIKVLYDIYHEQLQFGDLIDKFEKNIDQIGLIHVADVPGRHEPGTGEINFPNIYRKLGGLGYKHTIGMEFVPWVSERKLATGGGRTLWVTFKLTHGGRCSSAPNGVETLIGDLAANEARRHSSSASGPSRNYEQTSLCRRDQCHFDFRLVLRQLCLPRVDFDSAAGHAVPVPHFG